MNRFILTLGGYDNVCSYQIRKTNDTLYSLSSLHKIK